MHSSHRRHGGDNTVLSCLVRVGGVNRIGDKPRLSATENFETEHVLQFSPVSKCGVNRTCLQTCSHRRRDWTKLSNLQYIEEY